MTTYVVTFEIAAPSVREAFVAKLKTYSGYCPVHANCWAVATPGTAVQVRDALSPLLGPSDRVFVIRSGTEAAWLNSYGEDHDKWLQNNL